MELGLGLGLGLVWVRARARVKSIARVRSLNPRLSPAMLNGCVRVRVGVRVRVWVRVGKACTSASVRFGHTYSPV